MTEPADKKNKTFKVIDKLTEKEVEGAFVLIPEYDSAARVALSAYAEATNKPKIARWLRAWLHEIHRKRMAKKDYKDESTQNKPRWPRTGIDIKEKPKWGGVR